MAFKMLCSRNVDWGVYFLFTIFYKQFYFICNYGYTCRPVWGYVHIKPAEGVVSLSRWSYWKFLTACCGYWELNLSPLEEQHIFLTALYNACYRHPDSLKYSPTIEQSCSFFFIIWRGESSPYIWAWTAFIYAYICIHSILTRTHSCMDTYMYI